MKVKVINHSTNNDRSVNRQVLDTMYTQYNKGLAILNQELMGESGIDMDSTNTANTVDPTHTVKISGSRKVPTQPLSASIKY